MQGFLEGTAKEYRKHALSLARTEAIYFPSMGLLIGLEHPDHHPDRRFDVANHVPGALLERSPNL